MSAREVIAEALHTDWEPEAEECDGRCYNDADLALQALADKYGPDAYLNLKTGEVVRLEQYGSLDATGNVPCITWGRPDPELYPPLYRLRPITDPEPVCSECGDEGVIRETIYGPVDVDVNDEPCPTCKGDNDG